MRLSSEEAPRRARVYIVGAGAEAGRLCRSMKGRDIEVATFANAAGFLAGVQLDAPGAVIAALQLPDMSAFTLLGHLRRRGRELPLLVLTETVDASVAVQALRLGVFDLYPSPVEMPDFSARLDEALRVDTDRFDRRRLLSRARAAVSALSARERQVMERVVTGVANKVIAIDLGISEKTVEAHRGKMMRKMRVDSLAELVRVNVILEETQSREIGLHRGF